MLSKLRPRLNHGTVVAYLALFVALGGTSYAVATGSIDSREIKNNTVRSKDIRNSQVTNRDIRNGDVLSGDVRNGSLLAEDFRPGQLPRGATGPPGVSGYRVWSIEDEGSLTLNDTVPPGESRSPVQRCPAGMKALGGGVRNSFGQDFAFVSESRPLGDGTGWTATLKNTSSTDSAGIEIIVVCGRVSG